MRFSVDGWDPTCGTTLGLEDYLGESTASVEVNVEMPASHWRAGDPGPRLTPPAALLFVRRVRPLEAPRLGAVEPPARRPRAAGNAGSRGAYRGRRGGLFR